MRLDGKMAVVIGAASGIGRAIAEMLVQVGAHVLFGDIAEEVGAQVAEVIRFWGQGVDFIRFDVIDLDSIEAFRCEVYCFRQYVDIVVNVAGWGKIELFVQNTLEFWCKVVDLNFMGLVVVSCVFFDQMIERGAGKIVIVASDVGRVGSMGEVVYSGAKGGAIAFIKALVREVVRYYINVNCVCFGPIDTLFLVAVLEKY